MVKDSAANEGIESYLTVGEAGVFHPKSENWAQTKYRTRILGWRPGEYITFELPAARGKNYKFKFRNEPCAVSILCKGRAVAFHSVVLTWDAVEVASHFHVRWPDNVEFMSVRKYERVRTMLECELTDGSGTRVAGEIRDLSVGGFQVDVPIRLTPSSIVEVSFVLPDGTEVAKKKSVVKNARRTSVGVRAGCQFVDPDPDGAISFYVLTTTQQMRGANAGLPRVVAFERDAAEIDPYRDAIEDAKYELVAANGAIDGFSRLRMAAPVAVLVSCELQEVPAATICQIIRATPSYASIPIFLHGGDGLKSAGDLSGLKQVRYVTAAQLGKGLPVTRSS